MDQMFERFMERDGWSETGFVFGIVIPREMEADIGHCDLTSVKLAALLR